MANGGINILVKNADGFKPPIRCPALKGYIMGMFSKVFYSKKTRTKKKAKKQAKKLRKAEEARAAYLAEMALKGEGLLAMAAPMLAGSAQSATAMATLAEETLRLYGYWSLQYADAREEAEAAEEREAAQEAEMAAQEQPPTP